LLANRYERPYKLPRPKGRGIRRFASQLTSFAVPEERPKGRGIYREFTRHDSNFRDEVLAACWTFGIEARFGPREDSFRRICRTIVELLDKKTVSQPLAEKHRDRALTGDRKDQRHCNVKPDLVLIYLSQAG
jgi:hypothetical protein